MVDPQLTSGAAEKPAASTTERRLVGAHGQVSSEEEPAEGSEQQRSPAPLLDRIRRDRQDLEAKIAKLKGYISASTDMMNKLKDAPDMKERYESLTATRADLVQNAVNLQQLLVKLKQSESRASSLAGRERALAQETTARNEAAFSELTHELTPEMVAELDPEDRANYEKKRELLKRINQSQEKLRNMEVEQQRLRMMKENVEWKLAEAKANRMGLQEQAHELLHDMPGVHPAADATNWESTAAPDRRLQCPGWTERPRGGAAVGGAGRPGAGGGPAAPAATDGARQETPAAGRYGRTAGGAAAAVVGGAGASSRAPPTYRRRRAGCGGPGAGSGGPGGVAGAARRRHSRPAGAAAAAGAVGAADQADAVAGRPGRPDGRAGRAGPAGAGAQQPAPDGAGAESPAQTTAGGGDSAEAWPAAAADDVSGGGALQGPASL